MQKSLSFTALVGLTALLAACGSQPPAQAGPQDAAEVAPLYAQDSPTAIAGQYIVVLKKGELSTAAIGVSAEGGLIRSLKLDPQGVQVQNVYRAALNGFAAKLSARNLATLRSDARVAYIEQDQTLRASATQSGATWGLDRVDQRNLPLDGSYTYSTGAANVTAYIVDTGIYAANSDFGGRARVGVDEVGDGQNGVDCNGHGTHVAGTIGSATYGLAKSVNLVAVRVLDCSGSGSNSGVIAGVDWVRTNAIKPAVANLSLGGSASTALDSAIKNAVNAGVTFVVAAGNENQDACNVSPAREASAITVGATTSSDARSSFSNFGSCVDIFAPGSNIKSLWIGSATATNTISGTSMASPHVAGAAALVLAANPSYSPAQVAAALTGNATPNVVSGAGTGSPNKLLYTGTGGGTTPPPPAGTTYTGSLSSAGQSGYAPSSSGFSYAGGTLTGSLSGPASADFDLYIQKLSGGTWSTVARSEGSTSSESINYAAGSGTYRWRVYDYAGSGSFTLTEQR